MADTVVAEPLAVETIDLSALTHCRGLVGECDLPGHPELSTVALAFGALVEGETTVARCSQRPQVVAIAQRLAMLGAEVSLLKIRGTEIEQELNELLIEAMGYYAHP